MPVKHDVELIAFVLTPIFRAEHSYRLHIKPGFREYESLIGSMMIYVNVDFLLIAKLLGVGVGHVITGCVQLA